MPTGRPEPSTTPTPSRAELLAQLELAGRESSAATVMFHTAVAAKQGLSATEEKALDILMRRGPLTHAELAAETSLAPASVTDLIGRLESKGYASRERHPDDGRRVLVRVHEDKVYAAMVPLFTPWVAALHALYETFTDDQLVAVERFLREAAVAQRAAAEQLRAGDA
ncbi:MAG: MarR family transcriptional regulator [Solirubrobacteraceae bacterium]|nr:MarR family transcriptional regulator [Patulibacter sp.]